MEASSELNLSLDTLPLPETEDRKAPMVVAAREPDYSAYQTAFRPASDPSEERGENLSSGGKAATCAWQHWKSDTVPLLYDWLIHRKR